MFEVIKQKLGTLQASIEKVLTTATSETAAMRRELSRLDQGLLGPLVKVEGQIASSRGEVQQKLRAARSDIDRRRPPG